jgi:transposase InsO family protein
MTRLIDLHRDRFGVEPLCGVLGDTPGEFLAVSGYYMRKHRPPSRRSIDGERLTAELRRIDAENFGVYGARKCWRQLQREGFGVGRDRVERLMRSADLQGVRRGRHRRTTIPDVVAARPADLVDRRFFATSRTSSGSLTSPTSGPGRASATRPSPSTSTGG